MSNRSFWELMVLVGKKALMVVFLIPAMFLAFIVPFILMSPVGEWREARIQERREARMSQWRQSGEAEKMSLAAQAQAGQSASSSSEPQSSSEPAQAPSSVPSKPATSWSSSSPKTSSLPEHKPQVDSFSVQDQEVSGLRSLLARRDAEISSMRTELQMLRKATSATGQGGESAEVLFLRKQVEYDRAQILSLQADLKALQGALQAKTDEARVNESAFKESLSEQLNILDRYSRLYGFAQVLEKFVGTCDKAAVVAFVDGNEEHSKSVVQFMGIPQESYGDVLEYYDYLIERMNSQGSEPGSEPGVVKDASVTPVIR